MSGPQEGTPNGVDRLAQIEDNFRERRSRGITSTWFLVDDVLVLVEIAKAAREQAHEYPGSQWGYDGVGIHYYEGPESAGQGCPQCDALARLDRPSSDGTADSGAAEENT